MAVLGALLLLFASPLAAQNPDELYRAGRTAFEAGRTFEALELLGRLAEAEPGYRDVQLLLGQACLVANLPLPAKRHFETALAQDPGDGHAAFLLGFALYQGARWFEAAEALARARDLAPQNPFPSAWRSLALLQLGRPTEARAEVENALVLAPRDPTVLLALAEIELAEGQLAPAETRIRDVLAERPDSLEAEVLLARVVFTGGRYAEAVPILQRVSARAPERADVLYLLGQALLRSGEKDAGQGVLSRFQAQKAFEEEVRVLESKLRTGPDDLDARRRLVRLYLDRRQTAGAVLHLAVLEKLAPGDARTRALAAELDRLRR